jgi:hypothetical protein
MSHRIVITVTLDDEQMKVFAKGASKYDEEPATFLRAAVQEVVEDVIHWDSNVDTNDLKVEAKLEPA